MSENPDKTTPDSGDPDEQTVDGTRAANSAEGDGSADGASTAQNGDGAGAADQEAPTSADDGVNGPSSDIVDELETTRDRLLRLAAEFDNFRKRTERERAETWSRAQADLMEQILEPLDDLKRVSEHSDSAVDAKALAEGFQLSERKLVKALEALGLEAIEPMDEPFDPNLHEALMTTPAESPDEDETIGLVLQRGYQFKGILLRPARVQVRKFEG